MHQGSDCASLLILAAFGLGLVLFCWLLIRHDRKLAKCWSLVAEGEVERVEHGYYYYTRRTGAMVHTTTRYRADQTTIHFTDGRSVTVEGRRGPFERGTRLSIRRNGLGDHEIDL